MSKHEKRQASVRGNALFAALAVVSLAFLPGCGVLFEKEGEPVPPSFVARHTTTPIKIDGVLDDQAWQEAAVYQLTLGKDRVKDGKVLAEPGEARIAWDDTYLYVSVKYEDSDIVAEGEEDQLHHYRMGDLAELFIKPEDETWYWELYVTPAGKKTSFWFPGRGRCGLDSGWDYQCGLQVAAKCEGTLNKWEDKDTCWTGEMAMPIEDLTARGETFAPGAKWRIFVSRYNFSRYLPHKELSMTPQLAKTSYHRYEEYAYLELVK